MTALDDQLRDDATAFAPDLIQLRHALHECPEVGLHLPSTQAMVLKALEGLDLEITTGGGLSSVTAVLRGRQRGSAVLLRADMDALPVTEATGVDFASKAEGVMHACGHDLHVAMLVGAARLLVVRRDQLDGDVIFMFQPGEEGCDGAGLMLEEGVLEAAGSPVKSAYGMHVFSSRFPRGTFTSRPGTLMAASDALFVTVHGAGGHGSAPHLGRDPVTAAAEMVTALQTMVTRRFSIFDPVVITVGTFHAGTRYNIIPDDARLEATIRTFSAVAREQMRAETADLCRHVGAAHGLQVEVDFHPEYPLTVNDPSQVQFARQVVTDAFGEGRFVDMLDPVAGAEDFSRVLEEVPGCYLFLGAHTGNRTDGADNHSSRATFDDSVIRDGALLHGQLAVRALQHNEG